MLFEIKVAIHPAKIIDLTRACGRGLNSSLQNSTPSA
jgi:hypothetical protein